jgi:hypothetical protein
MQRNTPLVLPNKFSPLRRQRATIGILIAKYRIWVGGIYAQNFIASSHVWLSEAQIALNCLRNCPPPNLGKKTVVR